MNNKIKIVNKHEFGLGANVLMLAGAAVLVVHGFNKLVDTTRNACEWMEKYTPDECDWLQENSTEEPETTE